MRKKFELDPRERDQFERLRPIQGEALAFWARVAARRELDPKSVISAGYNFTALPKGHGKWWSFPIPLKCKKQPVYGEA
jgi:hypothetical protein